jgi:hypothetical protein
VLYKFFIISIDLFLWGTSLFKIFNILIQLHIMNMATLKFILVSTILLFAMQSGVGAIRHEPLLESSKNWWPWWIPFKHRGPPCPHPPLGAPIASPVSSPTPSIDSPLAPTVPPIASPIEAPTTAIDSPLAPTIPPVGAPIIQAIGAPTTSPIGAPNAQDDAPPMISGFND